MIRSCLVVFQGYQRWEERSERGPGLLRGGGGEEEAHELLSSFHPQQDAQRQETQLPAQR